MRELNTRHILLIHGAFISAAAWNSWKAFFESKGYKVLVPPWPQQQEPAPVLRQNFPDPLPASIRLKDLVQYYADIATAQPELPVLLGHGAGGLITQLLLQCNAGAAGITINSLPPPGLYSLNYAFLKSNFRKLGYYTSASNPYRMSYNEWQQGFTNGMPEEQQRNSYEQYVIPASRRLLRDCAGSAARVDFSKPHVPLLLLAGDNDQTIPASVAYKNFKKYKQNGYLTEFSQLPGRNHFMIGQPTWEEDAAFILNWIRSK
ncbi:alpha/beta hydrolase [Chitinophaga sp. Cy-1792]|uniref:alpha/beta hydrolase n=1 Tax=Chitinophaga sp. Cy-1792 TaxID=2608339 RepID=UPI00141DF622|nr:alpha/beta hydrolase [Chitinophaga sp. Cy-1792]NIG55158.1 alpha/beta hydrolase [Chitinophaga sp. Cy-1792]